MPLADTPLLPRTHYNNKPYKQVHKSLFLNYQNHPKIILNTCLI